MKVLITGVCGFVGSALVESIRAAGLDWTIAGIDNFVRPGSEAKAASLRQLGVQLLRGDLRCAADVDSLPAVDWVIDAAAVTSVRAGTDGQTSSRQLVEHNLLGTINLLEYCKRQCAGLVLLSTSRVYNIARLNQIDLCVTDDAYTVASKEEYPLGLSPSGISEQFSTNAPLSLYGATKLSSEVMALEYGMSFDFPVWINRCGIMAGAGQLGRADQGIFSYWIHSHLQRRPLRYKGYQGQGYQVRDCLHPRDLLTLIEQQVATAPAQRPTTPQVINVSGGIQSAMSLKQLTHWCDARFGSHSVESEPCLQKFDVPWLVLDSGQAHKHWNWHPRTSTNSILSEIAAHAEAHPEWLALSS